MAPLVPPDINGHYPCREPQGRPTSASALNAARCPRAQSWRPSATVVQAAQWDPGRDGPQATRLSRQSVKGWKVATCTRKAERNIAFQRATNGSRENRHGCFPAAPASDVDQPPLGSAMNRLFAMELHGGYASSPRTRLLGCMTTPIAHVERQSLRRQYRT